MGNFLHETCPGVGRGPLWRGPHLFGLGAALRATYGLSLLRGGPVTEDPSGCGTASPSQGALGP